MCFVTNIALKRLYCFVLLLHLFYRVYIYAVILYVLNILLVNLQSLIEFTWKHALSNDNNNQLWSPIYLYMYNLRQYIL